MKPSTFLLGLASSLLLSAGFTKAAEKADPMTRRSASRGPAAGTAQDCTWPCAFQATGAAQDCTWPCAFPES